MNDLTHEDLLEMRRSIASGMVLQRAELLAVIDSALATRAELAREQGHHRMCQEALAGSLKYVEHLQTELARLKAAPRYRIECDHVHHGMTAKADPRGGWIRYADVITNEEKAA